jgi:hypothetical protein
MQRAAASSPSSAPSTPEGPPSKRQRLSYGSNGSPATPSSDLRAVQAALAEEELKRNLAVERQAAEAGETRWVLSVREPERAVPALRVVQASFADIDAATAGDDIEEGEYDEDSHAEKRVAGRMSFGKVSLTYRHEIEHAVCRSPLSKSYRGPQVTKKEESDDSDDSESEVSEDDDDDDPTTAMIKQARREATAKARAERKAKKRVELAELQRFASDRRQKAVNLNKLTTISSSSSGSKFGASQKKKDKGKRR